MRTILLVDDEKQILRALERAFFDTEYNVLTASSASEALDILAKQKADLVISDMRMPFIDGYELLKQVKEKYPKTIRVIISAYSEEKTVIDALVRNIAKVYILKPWDNDELLRSIDHLFVTEDTLGADNLLDLLNTFDELPTIQKSYQNILSLIQSDADIHTIAREIEKDFAISSKLLQVVNSAFYGVKTGSIQQACMFLGLQNISNLILSTSIISAVNGFYINEKDFELIWNHALFSNVILSFIYERFLHKKLPEASLSAGLLHNIGLIVSDKLKKSTLIDTVTKSKQDRVNIISLETEELKVTHQEIGGYLLNWWELPFPIVEAALYHHRPFDPNIVNNELVACVHIAQNYAWKILLGENSITEFFPDVFERIGVSQSEFEKALPEELSAGSYSAITEDVCDNPR